MKFKDLRNITFNKMKKDWRLLLSICIILVNIIIFLVLEIDLISQLLFAAAIIIMTFSGALLLIKLKERFPDIIFFYISSFFCGAALAYFLSFLFFHQSILSLFHLHSLENASLVVFFLLLPLSFLGYLKTRRSKSSISFSKEGLLFSLLLSSIISFITYSGFQSAPFRISKENFEDKILKNISHAGDKKIILDSYEYRADEKKFYLKSEFLKRNIKVRKKWMEVTGIINSTGFKYSWGINSSKYVHILFLPHELMTLKFPSSIVVRKLVAHRGVQVFLIAITSFVKQLRGVTHFLDKLVDVYKMSALVFWFSLLYLVFIFSRHFLNLSIKISALVLFSLLFYAPILFPIFQVGKSSFHGFLIPTGSIYRNAPQLFSAAICLGGILLVFLSHKKKIPSFFVGSILISISFFFKPALFTITVPVIFFMSIFDHDRFSSDKILGYLALIMVPLYYKLYPMVFGDHVLKGFNFSLAPFNIVINKTKTLFPGIITQHKLWHVLSVFLMSFAALIPPVIYLVPVQYKKIKEFGVAKYLYSKKLYFYMSLPFVLGVLSYCLLIQTPRGGGGNFGWLSGSGIIIFIPVFLKLISEIDKKSLRYFTWFLFSLHLLNGVIYLFWIFL